MPTVTSSVCYIHRCVCVFTLHVCVCLALHFSFAFTFAFTFAVCSPFNADHVAALAAANVYDYVYVSLTFTLQLRRRWRRRCVWSGVGRFVCSVRFSTRDSTQRQTRRGFFNFSKNKHLKNATALECSNTVNVTKQQLNYDHKLYLYS